jgi:hypothetical protein
VLGFANGLSTFNALSAIADFLAVVGAAPSPVAAADTDKAAATTAQYPTLMVMP